MEAKSYGIFSTESYRFLNFFREQQSIITETINAIMKKCFNVVNDG